MSNTTVTTVERMWISGQYENNIQDSDGSSATLYFLVRGVETEEAAVDVVRTSADNESDTEVPKTYQGIPIRSFSAEERMFKDGWKIAVKYQFKDDESSSNDDNDENVFSFDFSSGTRKIVVPLASVRKYPSSAPASQGINDGEGVDIMMPVFKFSETTSMSLSTSKKNAIAALVGCVNSGSFKGYSAGEVLFTGCSGTKTGKEKWRVTFNFAVSMNQSGIKIGNISGIKKDGWDIVWVRYDEAPVESGSKKQIIRTAKAVYVERVYARKSFGSLGV